MTHVDVSVVEVSFDKVVGHLFIDSVSLLTHGWHQAEKFCKFDLFRSLEIAISDFLKDFFK